LSLGVHPIAKLKVPPLRSYGIVDGHLAVLAEKAPQASSMKGNPIPLTSQELGETLAGAL
jgi:hypothetical protein